MKIPQLTQEQFEMLNNMGQSESSFIAVPEIQDTDDPNLRAKLINKINEIEDLAAIGLLKDVSMEGQFASLIAEAKSKGNRGFKIFILTEMGIMFFVVSKDKAVN